MGGNRNIVPLILTSALDAGEWSTLQNLLPGTYSVIKATVATNVPRSIFET